MTFSECSSLGWVSICFNGFYNLCEFLHFERLRNGAKLRPRTVTDSRHDFLRLQHHGGGRGHRFWSERLDVRFVEIEVSVVKKANKEIRLCGWTSCDLSQEPSVRLGRYVGRPGLVKLSVSILLNTLSFTVYPYINVYHISFLTGEVGEVSTETRWILKWRKTSFRQLRQL